VTLTPPSGKGRHSLDPGERWANREHARL
jgi:hypothetical protein